MEQWVEAILSGSKAIAPAKSWMPPGYRVIMDRCVKKEPAKRGK